MTETVVKYSGYEIRVGCIPSVGNGKAVAMRVDQELVKTRFDKKIGELFGARVVGLQVT